MKYQSVVRIASEEKYLTIPLIVLIEVDTKAGGEVFAHSNYFPLKTQRLLEFGVEQVIWVLLSPKKLWLLPIPTMLLGYL